MEGSGAAVHTYRLAAWARRRARYAGVALVVGGLVVGAAIVGLVAGTEGAELGLALAAASAVMGLAMAGYLARMVRRIRLELDEDGVRYESGTHRIEAAWEDVVAVDLVIRGADTGPALVLAADRAQGGGGMLAGADVAGAVAGTGVLPPSLGSTIPLGGFIDGRLTGSPLERTLRDHIPRLVDEYLARHQGRERP